MSGGADGYYFDSGERLNLLDTSAAEAAREGDSSNGSGDNDDDNGSNKDNGSSNRNGGLSFPRAGRDSSPSSSRKSGSAYSTPAKELPDFARGFYAGAGRAPISPHSINKVHHFYSNIYNNNNNKYKSNEPVSSYIENEPLFYNLQTFSLGRYLKYEALGIDTLQLGTTSGDYAGDGADNEQEDSRYFERTNVALNNIKNFFRVPFKIEAFIGLGVLLCLDNYLYILTYLPLRTLYGAVLLLAHAANRALGLLLPREDRVGAGSPSGSSPKKERRKGKRKRRSAGPLLALLVYCSSILHWEYSVDLAKTVMVVSGFLVLQLLNMSRVYHFIRGQSMIKLYVLTSMIEICDR